MNIKRRVDRFLIKFKKLNILRIVNNLSLPIAYLEIHFQYNKTRFTHDKIEFKDFN